MQSLKYDDFETTSLKINMHLLHPINCNLTKNEVFGKCVSILEPSLYL